MIPLAMRLRALLCTDENDFDLLISILSRQQRRLFHGQKFCQPFLGNGYGRADVHAIV